MKSLGEKMKSITISVSLNNNNSVNSRGYNEVLSSSSSDEEDQKVLSQYNNNYEGKYQNDLPMSYMNALVIEAGDHQDLYEFGEDE